MEEVLQKLKAIRTPENENKMFYKTTIITISLKGFITLIENNSRIGKDLINEDIDSLIQDFLK